jgi:hypothetical protein
VGPQQPCADGCRETDGGADGRRGGHLTGAERTPVREA